MAYWALGWGLAYGEGGNPFCGTSQFVSYHLPLDYYPIWLFDVRNLLFNSTSPKQHITLVEVRRLLS